MLVNVQFLRFVAAMLVVLYHTAAFVPEHATLSHGLFDLGEATGFAGVDIFFVISGFIMAYTTMNEEGSRGGWDFVRRRLARIYSGHWPFFALALVIFAWTRPAHVSESNLTYSFFLWPQPLNRSLLEITWTLTFELYFYLLFSLLIWWVPRRRRPLVCLLIMLVLLPVTIYRHFIAGSFDLENFYYIPFWTHFLLSPFVLEFFAGTLVAYWLQRHRAGPALAWLVGGSALFLLCGGVNEWVFDGNIEQGFFVVPRVLGFGLASVMIIAGLVRMEHAGRVAPRPFSLLTGGASYAIYLSHIPILSAFGALGVFGYSAGLPFALSAIVAICVMALILAYSVAHYRLLERPLHRRFKAWLGVAGG